MTTVEMRTPEALADAERWTAHNYHPLPVVIAEADGAWVTDVDGRRYLDFLAGYSALNFGHRHPGLIAAAHAQLDRVTLTSRAFVHDQFAAFCRELAELCGKDLVLPMNTGAEAVENAVKIARAYTKRQAVVVFDHGYHGRTNLTMALTAKNMPYKHSFGPFAPEVYRLPMSYPANTGRSSPSSSTSPSTLLACPATPYCSGSMDCLSDSPNPRRSGTTTSKPR